MAASLFKTVQKGICTRHIMAFITKVLNYLMHYFFYLVSDFNEDIGKEMINSLGGIFVQFGDPGYT